MRSIMQFLTCSAIASSAIAAPDNRVSWRWDPEWIGLNCTLVQNLQSNDTPVSVGQFVGGGDPGSFVEIKARSYRFARDSYEDGWIEFANGVRLQADFAIHPIENRRYRVSATTDDPNFLSALAQSTEVVLGHPAFGRFGASVRDSAAAVTALRQCSDTLLRQWGIDPTAYSALQSRPKPIGQLKEFFSYVDYPSAAARMGMMSNIVAKLDVGADGLVQSCKAHGNHSVVDFVELVCTRLKSKARFEPARDANGIALAAPYVVVVKFVLI